MRTALAQGRCWKRQSTRHRQGFDMPAQAQGWQCVCRGFQECESAHPKGTFGSGTQRKAENSNTAWQRAQASSPCCQRSGEGWRPGSGPPLRLRRSWLRLRYRAASRLRLRLLYRRSPRPRPRLRLRRASLPRSLRCLSRRRLRLRLRLLLRLRKRSRLRLLPRVRERSRLRLRRPLQQEGTVRQRLSDQASRCHATRSQLLFTVQVSAFSSPRPRPQVTSGASTIAPAPV